MTDFEWRDGAASTITVNGKTLEAVCYGPPPGKAPTIVMLHEGLGCVALWRDFPRKVAEATGFGVFAWSRAGYGQSDPVELPRPLDYMTREALDVLPGVLDAIGFRYGILLGHSDGASIAAIYAGGVEDFRVRGLVLMAPHFFTEEAGLQAIAAAKTAYEGGDLRERLAKYHGHVDNAFYGWNGAWLDPVSGNGISPRRSTICAFPCSPSRAPTINTARWRRSGKSRTASIRPSMSRSCPIASIRRIWSSRKRHSPRSPNSARASSA